MFSEEAVQAALVDVPADIHGAVWLAAHRVTGRGVFRGHAKRWALPPELPWLK